MAHLVTISQLELVHLRRMIRMRQLYFTNSLAYSKFDWPYFQNLKLVLDSPIENFICLFLIFLGLGLIGGGGGSCLAAVYHVPIRHPMNSAFFPG